jgi:hypothetical protein
MKGPQTGWPRHRVHSPWNFIYLFICGYRDPLQGVKRPEYEFNWSSPFNADVKNEWSHTSVPAIRLLGVYRENFSIYFYLTIFSVTCVASSDAMVLNNWFERMLKHVNITSLDPVSRYVLEWQMETSKDLRQDGRMTRPTLKTAPSSVSAQNYVGHYCFSVVSWRTICRHWFRHRISCVMRLGRCAIGKNDTLERKVVHSNDQTVLYNYVNIILRSKFFIST